jgi:Holliday junction resolvase|tara:strand:+ start:1356 stop:1772 length:417 start_codon:yes stop_codon:yes gene_type:complete
MNLNKVHQFEQSIVSLLNLQGWNLEWCGGGFEHFDCIGTTAKGKSVVMEIKWRKKYYEKKMIEKYKFDKLLQEDADALYFVSDPKGHYIFWLNDLAKQETVELYCPDTTLWTKKRNNKECYLLDERDAHKIHINYATS